MFHSGDDISAVDNTQVVVYTCSKRTRHCYIMYTAWEWRVYTTYKTACIPMSCGMKNNSSGCPGGELFDDGRILWVFHSLIAFPRSFSIKCIKQNFRQSLKVMIKFINVTTYSIAYSDIKLASSPGHSQFFNVTR